MCCPAVLLQYMSAQDSPYCSWSDLYLPKGIRPVKYSLHVKSTLQPPYTVTGEVDIQLQAAEATPCVVLHAKSLQIQSVELLVYEGESNMHKQHPAGIKGEVRGCSSSCQHGLVVVQTGSQHTVEAFCKDSSSVAAALVLTSCCLWASEGPGLIGVSASWLLPAAVDAQGVCAAATRPRSRSSCSSRMRCRARRWCLC